MGWQAKVRRASPVHDGGPRRARDAIVVCLAQAPDGAHARLGQEVYRQVRQPLLGDHHVGLMPRHLPAQVPDVVLLELQQLRPGAVPPPACLAFLPGLS